MEEIKQKPLSTGFPLGLWEELLRLESHLEDERYSLQDFPKVSIIIPTVNSAKHISMTLDSILKQEYPNYEVIIVDNSTDRTLQIIRSYKNDKIQTFSVSTTEKFEMFNRGIAQATGDYVNFLFPGDFYIYHKTLKNMMTLVLDHMKPHMAYCGAQLRDPKADVKLLFRDLNIDILKLGQQPTSLQAMWFRTDILRRIGKFNPKFEVRGVFDLICRLYLQIDFRFASMKRVLADSELPVLTWHRVIAYFWETLVTVYRHFGFIAMLKWFKAQNDLSTFLRLWLQQLKAAFIGSKAL